MGSFWGITADGWVAIATFAGVLAVFGGILVGIWQVRVQIEFGEVNRSIFEEGVQNLAQWLDDLLAHTRVNYALVTRLLVQLQAEGDEPLKRPRRADIPPMLSTLPQLNARSIAATAQLIGAERLGELITRAYAQIYAVNSNFEFSARLPVLNYYEDESISKEDLGDWPERALESAKQQYFLVEEFRHIPPLLVSAIQIARKAGVRSFQDVAKAREGKPLREIADKLNALAESSKLEYQTFLSPADAPDAEASPT